MGSESELIALITQLAFLDDELWDWAVTSKAVSLTVINMKSKADKGCNGKNHEEYKKDSVAMNVGCAKKPPVVSIVHPKWHEHSLALFPRQAFLTCNLCAMADENMECQACITPIYFCYFYSCMQCDFILHEKCANLSRTIHHPIHPHLLTLEDNSVVEYGTKCSACPWLCTTGFFYECSKERCGFKLNVQCATISELLVHESHIHPLFLTSRPEENLRLCSVCKVKYRHEETNQTFNCIECDFALCFGCATLPQKVRYKHVLTLSYGKETSTMTYWCDVCEGKINPKKGFYMCDEYCCVTLHIECLIGQDLYTKPGSPWEVVNVLPNNHMSRPICSFCEKRCPHKIILHWSGSICYSFACIHLLWSKR